MKQHIFFNVVNIINMLSIIFKVIDTLSKFLQGGLRAIVWVDGIQSLIMLAGGLTLFIYATIQVGGFSSSVKALDEAGLNNIFKFA